MGVLRKPCLFIFPIILMLLFGGCAKKDAKIKLVVWGLQTSDETKGVAAAIAEFERRHPNVDVQALSMGAGGVNPQKLMTAVVGKVPPDVIVQDRFTIGDWASRDTFMPLDDLIKRDRNKPNGIKPEEFYHACWAEAVYKVKVYAIPQGTDDRMLFYNKTLFREAGIDPNRPPQTWDELRDYAVKLTKYRRDGGFEQIGFIPNFGNSWLYIYSWENDGEFMSPDGRTCTLNNPRSVEALEFMVSVYDALKGVESINSFSSGFKTNELDPFLTGKVAMKIDADLFTNNIARFAPDLDFGVAPAPVPRARLEGKPPFTGEPKFITWSGGFSYAIPVGAKHSELAWEFIKWMTSEEGEVLKQRKQKEYNLSKGRPYVPWMTANAHINEVIFAKLAPKESKFRKANRTCLDMMKYSRYRPVTFVGQRLWDEHVRAFEQAIYHRATPQAAMDAGTLKVQKELDKVFNRGKYPVLNWKYPLAVVCLLVIGFIIFLIKYSAFRTPHSALGRLSRGEAKAGYLFAAPWIIGFLVFTIGPVIASIIFSFCDYDVIHAARWVGLLNYHELLTNDWPTLSKTLLNAGFLALFGLPLGLITGLSIAMLLNTKVRGMTWYRTIYYLPSIVPVVANSLLWIWVMNPEFGLMNAAWRSTLGTWFSLEAPKWLADPVTAKPALIVMGLWGAGGGMILWLAGLQGVPQHLYEAAEIDGAGWWSKFWHVTLPMLTPYLFFNLIMGTIGVIQTFETVYIMTGGTGGPVDSTRVPIMYLFDSGFRYFKMGYASAIAWLLFVIILSLTITQLKLAPRWVHYESEKK